LSCITADDDPDQVALYVEEAAQSLAQAEVAAALRIPSRTVGHRVQEAATMTGVLRCGRSPDILPGTLAGFGAIPAGLARSIAASAGTLNALLTNPDTGTITAAGALTYRPTQELRDQIAHRHRRTPHHHPDPTRPEHKTNGIPPRRHRLGPRRRTMERPPPF
jgi:hypothetical protein